jgi:uncharacterized protein (DUF924 family)
MAMSTTAINVDAERVLAFWFDRPPLEWIIAPSGLDSQIASSFHDLVLRARNNELDTWTTSPQSCLALLILLEQFPRNIYRGLASAFTSDAKAYLIATRAIAQDFDKQVSVIQASAFYMPLMQQESLITLIAARCLFETLKGRCETQEEHEWVTIGVKAMGRHVQQLVRFGRYPTRNRLLGRESTVEEEEFLESYAPSL